MEVDTDSSIKKCSFFFFFNDTATTEIYTLSLHDALPISYVEGFQAAVTAVKANEAITTGQRVELKPEWYDLDRKSTRLNSSHSQISYAVFCLKKKKNHNNTRECHLGTDTRPTHASMCATD